MDKAETLDVQLRMILENLKKLGGGDNEQLHDIKKYVQDEICALLDAEPPLREGIVKSFDQSKLQLSRSLVEGAMTARWFQNKKDWKEIEVDVMFNLFIIPQETSHLIEPVEDKAGFVRLPYNKTRCSDFYTVYAEKFLRDNQHAEYTCDQIPYISPNIIKDYFLRGKDSFFRNMLQGSESKTETTVEGKLNFLFFYLSIDKVPAVRLLFWSHQAATWITRCRLWLPQDTIQSIVDKGCQVVPRSSQGGNVHTEWRLSFSGPEAILAQLRTKNQQLGYYFFKMFFYRYLKCVESSEPEAKSLYSYIIKTTMLWACEELSPEDPIWASLEYSVQMLLFKLLGSLEVGFLSHYFIPEINLLERVGGDVRIRCTDIISRWQSNILMTVPFDMPEKREYIHFIHMFLSLTHDMRKDKDFMSFIASVKNQLGYPREASWLQR